ncbi:MAG TPA: YajG family lipoprotein [Candidatus Polarisedimenticolaceae bacterium]|nr:YajG family lipoprotein [Candidatus Polarisedimenticolaceae bacterium]
MRTIRLACPVLVCSLALAAAPALAGEDLIIPLKFIPTTKPGSVRATLQEGVSSKPVALVVEDSRTVTAKDLVGDGTGAKDDTFRIRYAGHLPSYLKTTLQDRFNAWGIQFDDKSDLVLQIRTTRFYVHETHAFLASTFTAEVQLPWTLADRTGHVFATGTAMGSGKTKGRWRNAVNCEEVLADALQEAAVGVAGDAKLQEAWIAAKPSRAPAVADHPTAPAIPPIAMAVPPSRLSSKAAPAKAAALPKTPAQLLVDVNRLRRQQLGTSVLVDFVSKQTLATGFTANDLMAWKRAGVPEPVMRAALARAP